MGGGQSRTDHGPVTPACKDRFRRAFPGRRTGPEWCAISDARAAMRRLPLRSFWFLRCLSLARILAVALFATAPLPAHARDLDDLLTAVVRVKTSIEPDGRTVATLGREREGSGVLIDTEGLVLTIGYLM